jgi:ascorbate-specific PTS system EIIC-type component UlaA
MEQFFLIGLGVGIGVIITEEPYSKIIRARIHAFLG